MALALLAMACFAMLDTTSKYVTTTLEVSVLMALWVRYMFQAVATSLVMLPLRGKKILRTRQPLKQFIRGVLLTFCSLFAFICLRFMQVGEFTAIAMITPLVVTLLAAGLLAEKVSALRWALVAGGFAGTLIIIRPGSTEFSWVLLLPLVMVAMYSAFQILTSKMVKTEDAITMHFYTGWVGAVLSSLALPFVWNMPHGLQQWAGLLFMGALGTVGHYFLLQAYRHAQAASITPLMYAQIGFAVLGGWWVFDHVPDGWSQTGMLLIAVCGATAAWLSLRESRLRLEPLEV
jgi:drug/metabolite transporter (DMT)-like permease